MSDTGADRNGRAGLRIWQAVAKPAPSGAAETCFNRSLVRALCDRVTPATVAAILPGAGIDPAAVRQSQLLNRFRHVAGRRWLAAIADAGIPVLAIKGMASGAWLYPQAQDRGISDADLLVRGSDLGTVLDLLQDNGFAFADVPTRSRWGFVSEASFQPLLSPGGAVNIDLHVAGDAAPFAEALSTADMLDAAQMADGIGVPAPTHAFLVAASHAARDLFTADAAKTVIDGLLMFRRPGLIDWSEVACRSRQGRMTRPVSVMVALLGRLGADVSDAARELPVAGVGGGTFERVVRDHCTMFPASSEAGTGERLLRQWCLAAAPSVALRRDLRRLTGLFRPHSGLPVRPDAGAR